MSETLAGDEWVQRILGISPERQATPAAAAAAPPRPVRAAPMPVTVPPPGGPAVRIGAGRPRAGAMVGEAPPIIGRVRAGAMASRTPPAPEMRFVAPGERELKVARSPTGGVVFTAPPPPVREVTFSGGGGKGVALAGAVRALRDGGVLADAKVITGASVGSMTAALVAAGITPEEFVEVANAQETTDRIVEGTGGTKTGLAKRAAKNKLSTGDASPLTGMGLEEVVRETIDSTLGRRIAEYRETCVEKGRPVPADVDRISQSLATNPDGATFGDMRALAAVVPGVKEVVITGTYTTELGTKDTESAKGFKNQNETGQLYVFSADTEPKMPVALAVHASASFPAAFKPVDITLSSGLTVRFIDGGVMNNTPTSASIGNERRLDPMPQQRGISFVFEGEDSTHTDLLAGKVTPGVGKKARAVDWFVGSNHKGAEYGKDSNLALRPEEIVVVPLKLPPLPGKSKPEYDLRDGTLDFNVPDDIKLKFQDATAVATTEQIDREKEPKTREFASDEQMFVSIAMDDLRAMAASDYPGAAGAVVFRTRVAEMIGKLHKGLADERQRRDAEAAVKGEVVTDPSNPRGDVARGALDDKDVQMALAEFDTLAGGNVDLEGYVAREMNRGGLDDLIAAARKAPPGPGGGPGRSLQAAFAVSDAVRVQDWGDRVLKEVVYPKLKRQNEGGSGLGTLLQVETLVRKARTPAQYNAALRIGIDHFKDKSDTRPLRGHKELAQLLAGRLMPTA